MPIEKQATTSQSDLRELIKTADQKERIVVVDLDEYLQKSAVAVLATGPRAQIIRKIMEEMAGG